MEYSCGCLAATSNGQHSAIQVQLMDLRPLLPLPRGHISSPIFMERNGWGKMKIWEIEHLSPKDLKSIKGLFKLPNTEMLIDKFRYHPLPLANIQQDRGSLERFYQLQKTKSCTFLYIWVVTFKLFHLSAYTWSFIYGIIHSPHQDGVHHICIFNKYLLNDSVSSIIDSVVLVL